MLRMTCLCRRGTSLIVPPARLVFLSRPSTFLRNHLYSLSQELILFKQNCSKHSFIKLRKTFRSKQATTFSLSVLSGTRKLLRNHTRITNFLNLYMHINSSSLAPSFFIALMAEQTSDLSRNKSFRSKRCLDIPCLNKRSVCTRYQVE